MSTDLNKSPLISVIIPCFNSEKYIGETLKSVLNQSYQNFEIIVVDDESTDNSYQIVKKMALNDKRINNYKIIHSGRPSVPRNFGIGKAAGSLIAFLDSDDLWTKEKLMYQLKIIGNNPGISFVYSMSFTFGDVNFLSEHFELFPLPFRIAHNKAELIKMGNTIPVSSVLIRKAALEKVGGFNESADLKAVEDYDLWLRLSDKLKFQFIPRIHLYYRIHKEQSSTGWDKKAERLKILAEKQNIKLPEYKYFRRKGLLPLMIRNSTHFIFYLVYKITGYIENKDRLVV